MASNNISNTTTLQTSSINVHTNADNIEENNVENMLMEKENQFGRIANYTDPNNLPQPHPYEDEDEYSILLKYGKGSVCFMDIYNLRGDLYGEWHARWEIIPKDVILPFETSIFEYTGCTSKMILRKYNLCYNPPLSNEEKKESELVGATTPTSFYAYLCHLGWIRSLNEFEAYRRNQDRINHQANMQYMLQSAITRDEIEDWVCKRFQLLCTIADIQFQKVFLWYRIEKIKFDRIGTYHESKLTQALYQRYRNRRILDCRMDVIDYLTLEGITEGSLCQNISDFYELGLPTTFNFPYRFQNLHLLS